jgi:hypothetical protein
MRCPDRRCARLLPDTILYCAYCGARLPDRSPSRRRTRSRGQRRRGRAGWVRWLSEGALLHRVRLMLMVLVLAALLAVAAGRTCGASKDASGQPKRPAAVPSRMAAWWPVVRDSRDALLRSA